MGAPFKTAVAGTILALGTSGGTAFADEWDVPQPAWEGVWQGTVGTLPVHVCLDKTPYDLKGAYYYDRVRDLLRLEPGKDGEWLEQDHADKTTARWRISARQGGLDGTWSDGRKQLPVSLSRIGGSSKDFDGPCGSVAFNRPRLAPVKLASKHAVKDGSRYTSWTFKPGPWLDEVEVTTFTLDGPGAPVARVNALLRSALPKPDGTGEWFDCVLGSVNAFGRDGTYMETIEPTLITTRWLAVADSGEYYCGGAHPDAVTRPRTFDLAQGIEVDPLDWLGATAVKRQPLDGAGGVYKTLTPPFRATVLQGWKAEDSDCDDAVRHAESWNVGIAHGALVFSPGLPHVVAACIEDITVPLCRLRPWLNEKGKTAVASLPQ